MEKINNAKTKQILNSRGVVYVTCPHCNDAVIRFSTSPPLDYEQKFIIMWYKSQGCGLLKFDYNFNLLQCDCTKGQEELKHDYYEFLESLFNEFN